ncbi:unnamed protein product [Schistosoma rodhaini]|uniref:Cadherin domain-containing protein n=1 Tax=Schistosoma rodhaini TaxID=6188 RepID=A0AA85FQ63_9TREM|nr:unnamed protein product [Schistosoma rodhaini]
MLVHLEFYFICQIMIFMSNVWILKMIQANHITMVTNHSTNNNSTNHGNNNNNMYDLLPNSTENLLNKETQIDLINRLPRYTQILSSSSSSSPTSSSSSAVTTFLGSEFIQLSYHCIVYDETPAQYNLLDETNGNTCQLLSPSSLSSSTSLLNTQMIKTKHFEKLFINVNIITTANPMAKYFNINLSNYTLYTSQHIDREELCNQAMIMTMTSSIPDSLRTCCINRRKECIFPLNILVQTRIGRDDDTTTNTVSSSSDSDSSTISKHLFDKRTNHESSFTSDTATSDISSISISSSSSRSKFFTIHIKLIDINDNAPKFPNPQYTIHVSEGIHVGSRLPLPLAEDLDCIDYNIIRYQLLTQGDDTFELIQLSNELITNLPSLVPSTSINNQPIYSSNFNSLSYETQMEHTYTYHQQPTVNQVLPYQNRPEQLYLKVMKQLDWETKRQYHFILNAEDSGSPAFTGEMSLMIIVTDENDNHPIFRNKSLIINVPENSPEGLHLIQLIADDPDEGKSGQIIYSLVNNEINIQTPTSSSSSPSSLSSSLSNNDHSNQRPLHTTIYNSSTLGLNTINTNSNSNDNSNEIRKGLFDIDPKTGWLILNDHLDYEKSKHHLIRVIARDQSDHPGYDEAIVSIYVTDINDVAPQITVESVNRISSSQSIHDHDHHHHHQYKNNNVLYVYVNETPGRNTNNYQLDNEHLNEYSILTKMTQLLAFIVVNDPDTGPGGTFQCYLEPIDSNKALRSNMYTSFSMKEHDHYLSLNPTTTSTTSTSTSTTANGQSSIVGMFQLNSISNLNYELITIYGFDYEMSKRESVKIVCSDNGKPSLTSSHVIKVIVQDLNDNPPVFSKDYYNFFVQENSPINTLLNKVLATDADSEKNAEIKYQISQDGKEFFSINQLDGSIYTKMIFDRELKQNYRFQVYANDNGQPISLTSTTTIEVTIIDVNDNTPQFVGLDRDNCYHFRIAENQPPNTYVGILLGTDNDIDENAQLHFRLLGTTSNFRLNSSTGELTTLQLLDREKQSNYELIVLLIDHGKPSRSATAKVHIHVTDINDHDPIVVFPVNGKGNISVSYREPPGEIVARIEARDPDEGHNSLLHFNLYSGNEASVFRLGSTSAELIIDRELTVQDIGLYPLIIHIQDAGIPSRTTEVKLLVKITDSPPRHIYSNRFTNLYHSKKNDLNHHHPQLKDQSYYHQLINNNNNNNEKLIKINEINNQGIIIYVCERRGFQNFCSNHHITNTNTTINRNIHNNDNNHDDSHLSNPMKYLLHNHHSFNNNNKKNYNNITTLYPNKSILIDNHNNHTNHNDKCLNYYYHSNNSIQFNHDNNQYIDQSNHLPYKSILIENNPLNDHDHENNQYIDPSNNIPFQSILIENNQLNDHDNNNNKEYTTLPLNEKQYWILKNDEYTLPNQYEQKILSFIHNNHQEKLSRQQQQQQQHDNDQQNLNIKSTISMNSSTIDFITNTTISSNHNTMVTITDNNMSSSMINNNKKMNPIYFTQSLKLKKLNTSINNNQNHNDINNDPLNNHVNERNPLKISRSWEYIAIPHNNQSLSPLSSIKGKHNKPQEQQQKASWTSNNQTIPSNKSTTILSPQESTIRHTGNCLSDNQSFTTICTNTTTTTTATTTSTTATVTSSKYIDYTTIEQNSNHLKTFNKQYNTNLSVLYLNNSKNIIDSNQLNHKQQINNQSFIPINLIDLADQQLYNMKSYPCDHSIMNDSRYPPVSNHSNNINNNNAFIYMINDQQYSHSHHHHQNNDNNSPASTDFV